MARTAALYEVVNASSHETRSRHCTRQAAVDTWRLKYAGGMPVRIYRIEVPAGRKLIVEGTWHESQRG